ncbi:MAG: hypothetical protein K2X27_28605, partial [Candidatus Obscuribacterales bacterium]|nr:hypothetical protein [Candidatus Obscuribacterales bacterium]
MKKLRTIAIALSGLIVLSSAAGQTALASSKKGDKSSSQEKKTEIDTSPVQMKDLVNIDALTRWMTYYYLHPQPELLVQALLLADKQGLLQGDSAAPLQAFTSRVMAQNPAKLKDWFAQMAPMSEPGKSVMLTAIWWSNTSEGKELLNTIGNGLPEKSKAEFHKQIDGAAPEIETM